MKSHWKNVLGGAMLVTASTLVTTQVVSQYDDDKGAEADAIWQEWMKLGEPGAEHESLTSRAGVWKQSNMFWPYPGSEAMASTGSSQMKSILGGRYLSQHVTGAHEFQGQHMEFEGHGLYGYDNLTKKHFYAWIDNHSTMLMTGEGTADATGKVVTYFSEVPDPMAGGTKQVKTVVTNVSADEYVMEVYEKQPTGKWFKNMKIISTR